MVWSKVQRRLHWWVAGLVLGSAALGFVMVELPFSALAAKFLGYQLHKSIGIIVFLLVLWRLVLRWRLGRPEAEGGWPAAAGHVALYALLLGMPVVGYLMAASAPGAVETTIFLVIPVPHVIGPDEARFTVLQWVHWAGAVLLLGLVAGHVAMAAWHHRAGSDVLRRMWRDN